MFPVTHIHFHSLIYNSDTPGIIGAVFPDTILLSKLRWPDTHKRSVEFFNFTLNSGHINRSEKEKTVIRAFAGGFLTHSVDSCGLDYYGDEKYNDYEKGYSYLKATPLIPEVIRACRIPESMGHWKAHNFIEMGIESLIAGKISGIREKVDRILEDKETVSIIASYLSEFYGLEEELFEEGIRNFTGFIQPSGDPLQLGKSYSTALKLRSGIEDADPGEIAEVIEMAKEIIADEYDDFFLECRTRFLERWAGVIEGKRDAADPILIMNTEAKCRNKDK